MMEFERIAELWKVCVSLNYDAGTTGVGLTTAFKAVT